jgi:hypothetical protein
MLRLRLLILSRAHFQCGAAKVPQYLDCSWSLSITTGIWGDFEVHFQVELQLHINACDVMLLHDALDAHTIYN